MKNISRARIYMLLFCRNRFYKIEYMQKKNNRLKIGLLYSLFFYIFAYKIFHTMYLQTVYM